MVAFSSEFLLIILFPLMLKMQGLKVKISPKTIWKPCKTQFHACRASGAHGHVSHFTTSNLPLHSQANFLPQEAAFLVQNTPSPLCFTSFIRLSLLPHDKAETHLHCTSFFGPCLLRLCQASTDHHLPSFFLSSAGSWAHYSINHHLRLLSSIFFVTLTIHHP